VPALWPCRLRTGGSDQGTPAFSLASRQNSRLKRGGQLLALSRLVRRAALLTAPGCNCSSNPVPAMPARTCSSPDHRGRVPPLPRPTSPLRTVRSSQTNRSVRLTNRDTVFFSHNKTTSAADLTMINFPTHKLDMNCSFSKHTTGSPAHVCMHVPTLAENEIVGPTQCKKILQPAR
jgi:hypothetical protein